MSRRAPAWAWPLAAAAALPAVALPISNPDLFWHLSAARRMLDTHAVPKTDWLSWTATGQPWVDFEWLTQLVFAAAHGAAGLTGLFALKVALMLVAAWRLNAWLSLYSVAAEWRAGGVALWAAAMLPGADIRPELFSLIFFIELFRRLEAWRLGGPAPKPWEAAAAFALWTNLHAGFAYGLALAVGYSFFGLPWRIPLAAAAGTLLNPNGPWIYGVIFAHGAEASRLSQWIAEWKPINPANPWRWAELSLVPISAAGAALARRKRALAGAPALALLGLAVVGLRHVRLDLYFIAAAVPLSLGWLTSAQAVPGTAAFAGAMVALLLLGARCALPFGALRRAFQDRFVPEATASFLEREAATLASRRLYNPWGWGGYFGWRLSAYSVFQDGRYLFHSLLFEAGDASADAASWGAFLDRRGVDVAVMENVPLMMPTTRRYPDGTEKSIRRPYYVLFMPRENWALVHYDAKALVFVRRGAAPESWIRDREVRWLRPYDDAAFKDAFERKEIPEGELSLELARRYTASGGKGKLDYREATGAQATMPFSRK